MAYPRHVESRFPVRQEKRKGTQRNPLTKRRCGLECRPSKKKAEGEGDTVYRYALEYSGPGIFTCSSLCVSTPIQESRSRTSGRQLLLPPECISIESLLSRCLDHAGSMQNLRTTWSGPKLDSR